MLCSHHQHLHILNQIPASTLPSPLHILLYFPISGLLGGAVSNQNFCEETYT